jgi:hypothetical protein
MILFITTAVKTSNPAHFDPEDGGDMFLQNVGCNSTNYTVSYPKR